MTVDEIKKALDERGIEYGKKAKKAELEALLAESEQAPEQEENRVSCEVVRPFWDKYDDSIQYKVGDRIEVAESRFAEMNEGHERVVRIHEDA